MRTLLIDNHDSYTYNLYQLLAKVHGTLPEVMTNDDPTWDDVDFSGFDALVISPGPGTPANPRDFGHSRDALTRSGLPALGVCLGHQGIGLLSGADVVAAPQPRHGHRTAVKHLDADLFAGLPQGFTAIRYHSLCVAEPLPDEVEATAWSEDGVIMGLRHRERPWWGVQFHPESVSTERAEALIRNFRTQARRIARTRHTSLGSAPVPGPPARRGSEPPAVCAPAAEQPEGAAPGPVYARVRRIGRAVDTERVYVDLYATHSRSFWLDSSRVEEGLSRFSFLGSADGPDDEVLTYRVGDPSVIVESAGCTPRLAPGSIFDALRRRLGGTVTGGHALPFDLVGGYVGYFGYELKADLGARRTHRATAPDAVWMRASRLVAVDHLEDCTYLVAVTDGSPEQNTDADDWLERTVHRMEHLGTRAPSEPGPAPRRRAMDASRYLSRNPDTYLSDIAECDRLLRAGESYEICLTNNVHLPAPADDLAYYLRLRRLNPAPYAALFRMDELTVFCSSPERFLRVSRDRTVESKPIKGTVQRSADPVVDERLRASLAEDPKTLAENLMIVDLLRNDLGRVCDIASVQTPKLMATESYATVHQLVSTVRGRLRSDVTTIDCVKACFPGGSMTGAPKLRTMEIIDALETEARGVYSGALGYLALSGAADLSIVIRTAVRWRSELTVGAGGAIVLGSDPGAELDEMLLKADATLSALPPDGQDESTGGNADSGLLTRQA